MEQSTQSTSFSSSSGMTLKEFKQELIDYGRTCIPEDLKHLIRIEGSSESKNMYLVNTKTKETVDLIKRKFGRDSISTQIANNVDIESLQPLRVFEFDISDNSKSIAELFPKEDETNLFNEERKKVKDNVSRAISDVKTSIYRLIEASKKESNKQSTVQQEEKVEVQIEEVEEDIKGDYDLKVAEQQALKQLLVTANGNERSFYIAGHDWDNIDQLPRFIENNIWENGHEDKQISIVNSANVGDILFAKTTWVRGKSEGMLTFMAIGIVLENPRDGHLLQVNWFSFPEKLDLNIGSQYRRTFQRISQNYLYEILKRVLRVYENLPEIINELSILKEDSDIGGLIRSKIEAHSNFWWINDYRQEWTDQTKTPTTTIFATTDNYADKISSGELLMVSVDPNNKHLLQGVFQVKKIFNLEIEADLLHEFDIKISIDDLQNNKKLHDWGLLDVLLRDISLISSETFYEVFSIAELANPPSSRTEKDPVKSSIESTKDKIPFHNDVVAQEDKLGREPVAKAFVDLIKKDVFTEDMNHAFMVHLQGEWGAGKSTFLNLIKKHLNDGKEEWIVIDYNAWQNQHITPPWWTLIDQIYRQTKIRKPFDFFGNLWRGENWRRIKLYSGWQKTIAIFLTLIIVSGLVYFGKSIIDFVLGIPFFAVGEDSAENEPIIATIGKLLVALGSIVTIIFAFSKVLTSSFFTISSDEANSFLKRSADPMSRIKTHFGGLVNDINSKEKTRWWSKSNKKKRQLAIFIDDIDRCNRGFIIQLLEGIQTLFKEKKVLYIVAGDKNWITTSFANTYSEFNQQSSSHHNLGELFLEKAFQMSLRMPNISDDSKEEYWSHILGITETDNEKKVEVEEISSELKNEVQQELDSTEEDITSPEFIEKFEKKHNFSSNAASRLIIEKKNESDKEIRHLLKDLHGLVETNPRSIIRLANNYTMTRSTLIAERKSFNAEKLLRWLILKDLYPTVIDSIRSNKSMEEIKVELSEPSVREKYEKLVTGSKEEEADILTLEEVREFEGI
jgi:hypothetical protein